MEYTIVVSATASASRRPMQYISPLFRLHPWAEYFMDQGKDVLIVYDDLSPSMLWPTGPFLC